MRYPWALQRVVPALGHRSVSCVPLNTAARRTTLGQRSAARALDNLDY